MAPLLVNMLGKMFKSVSACSEAAYIDVLKPNQRFDKEPKFDKDTKLDKDSNIKSKQHSISEDSKLDSSKDGAQANGNH